MSSFGDFITGEQLMAHRMSTGATQSREPPGEDISAWKEHSIGRSGAKDRRWRVLLGTEHFELDARGEASCPLRR